MNATRPKHTRPNQLGPLIAGITGVALLVIFWPSARQIGSFLSGTPKLPHKLSAPLLANATRLTPVSPGIRGVMGSVAVKAGATPLDAMDVTVRYSVPPKRRICIRASTFQNISLGPSPHERLLYPKKFRPRSGGCIAHARDGLVSMTVKVHRNDVGLPTPFWLTELPGAHPSQSANEDGFVIVMLQVGDHMQLDRIDSPLFARRPWALSTHPTTTI